MPISVYNARFAGVCAVLLFAALLSCPIGTAIAASGDNAGQSSMPAPPIPQPAKAPARSSSFSQSDGIETNDTYLQCTSRMAYLSKDPDYISDDGLIGIFQFDLATAAKAGLCKNPVPIIRRGQLWKFCDFQGPVALKYQLHNAYDLRFDGAAKPAQYEMMKNLIPVYDGIIYRNRYDLQIGQYIKGIKITLGILRGLLHVYGPQMLDEFIRNQTVTDKDFTSPYTLGVCLEECLRSNGKKWFCGE